MVCVEITIRLSVKQMYTVWGENVRYLCSYNMHYSLLVKENREQGRKKKKEEEGERREREERRREGKREQGRKIGKERR